MGEVQHGAMQQQQQHKLNVSNAAVHQDHRQPAASAADRQGGQLIHRNAAAAAQTHCEH
jgi:hypothetical protein